MTYDLHQVDAIHLESLRDTLLTALDLFSSSGPRTIITQLCLAVSGFALQFTAWKGVVDDMISRYGRTPNTVPALLEFLAVLPEELTGNTKIPVSVSSCASLRDPLEVYVTDFSNQNDDYKQREAELLTDNAEKVVEILGVYISAPGAFQSK